MYTLRYRKCPVLGTLSLYLNVDVKVIIATALILIVVKLDVII
jgi:hypothetical protein